MNGLADLTDRERREYDESGDRDRRWFACRAGARP